MDDVHEDCHLKSSLLGSGPRLALRTGRSAWSPVGVVGNIRRARLSAIYSPMNLKHVLYERTDDIARVTVDRPGSLNAISRRVYSELDQAISDAEGAMP